MTVGDRLGQVALAVLALDLTDSALIVGITVSARHVPLLVLSRAGGQIIDRARNKASLIAATQAASAGLTIAFYALVSAGHATATAVVSFALVSGVCNVVDLPARWALVGELVGERHIARATSLATTAMAVGRACGPALASAIIAFGSISVVFAANSVTFALTAVIFAALAPRLAQAGHAEHAPVSIPARRGGIAGGLRSPALGPALALTLAVTVFALNTEAVLIVFVRDSFVRESYYGPLLAAMGVGAICGALGAGWWRTPRVAGLAALAASLGGALLVMGLATTIVGRCRLRHGRYRRRRVRGGIEHLPPTRCITRTAGRGHGHVHGSPHRSWPDRRPSRRVSRRPARPTRGVWDPRCAPGHLGRRGRNP